MSKSQQGFKSVSLRPGSERVTNIMVTSGSAGGLMPPPRSFGTSAAMNRPAQDPHALRPVTTLVHASHVAGAQSFSSQPFNGQEQS
jgi:hypothetical protein